MQLARKDYIRAACIPQAAIGKAYVLMSGMSRSELPDHGLALMEH
jgi:hypothetical protein